MPRRKKPSGDGYRYYQYIGMDGMLHDVEEKSDAEPEKPKERKKPQTKAFKQMFTYHYEGPIKQWEKTVITNFDVTTNAVSEKKAIQNVLFRAKRELGYGASAGGFRLVNRIKLIGQEKPQSRLYSAVSFLYLCKNSC